MEPLLYVGIVHCFFTATFLLSKRDGSVSSSSVHDRVLAPWMVAMALPLLSGALVQDFPQFSMPILRDNLIYPLTFGPFMWLYVGTLTGHISKFQRKHLLHFLPFALLSLFQIATGWQPNPPNPEAVVFSRDIRLVGLANLVLFLAYGTAVLWRLHGHDRDILAHFSELSNRITLGWLRWLIVGLSTVFLLLFLASAFSWPALLGFHLMAQIAAILVLSFFGIKQTQVFPCIVDENDRSDPNPQVVMSVGTENEVQNMTSIYATRTDAAQTQINDPAWRDDQNADPAQKIRYARSGLSQERADRIAKRLNQFMCEKKPYLDPELTIEKLAKQMGVVRHHLTQVISERHDMNFYLFVNDYRIQSIKQVLNDPKRVDETLLDIAHSYGFNSKSTFNTAFKRLTGTTPSKFRIQAA